MITKAQYQARKQAIVILVAAYERATDRLGRQTLSHAIIALQQSPEAIPENINVKV